MIVNESIPLLSIFVNVPFNESTGHPPIVSPTDNTWKVSVVVPFVLALKLFIVTVSPTVYPCPMLFD